MGLLKQFVHISLVIMPIDPNNPSVGQETTNPPPKPRLTTRTLEEAPSASASDQTDVTPPGQQVDTVDVPPDVIPLSYQPFSGSLVANIPPHSNTQLTPHPLPQPFASPEAPARYPQRSISLQEMVQADWPDIVQSSPPLALIELPPPLLRRGFGDHNDASRPPPQPSFDGLLLDESTSSDLSWGITNSLIISPAETINCTLVIEREDSDSNMKHSFSVAELIASMSQDSWQG